MKSYKWKLDKAHSDVNFKVRHLLISNVSGNFRQFDGSLEVADPDTFVGAKLSAIIDVYSIDTNETDRDEHLKTDEFLSADQFPEIKLEGSGFQHEKGDDFSFNATLTIKGITKQIPFKMEFGGEAKDGFGNHRAAIEIKGKINRKDFGIHYNAKNDSGSLVIGEEISLGANLQFIREEK